MKRLWAWNIIHAGRTARKCWLAELLVHRQTRGGARDLPALLEAADFTAVEAGESGFRPLGFARRRVRG